MPKEIKGKDLDVNINNLYVMRYPQDFMALKFFRNGRNSQNMVLPTIIDVKDPFIFEA